MPNQRLYLQVKTLLQQAYQRQNQPVADHLLKTLAMMVTGMILQYHMTRCNAVTGFTPEM